MNIHRKIIEERARDELVEALEGMKQEASPAFESAARAFQHEYGHDYTHFVAIRDDKKGAER